ncbi:hypothetical protein [Arenimonas sp.]|uniref:hypothetical protein n=1 Tax=Arenimonas sp. TaxID=1872635 RepID=UPI0039E62F0A
MNRSALLIAIATATLLAGCGKFQEAASEAAAEKAIEASTGKKVDINNEDGRQSVTIETDKGTYTASSGENVALPPSFPKDVHLPADAKLMSAMSMGQALSVTLTSQQTLSATYETYRKAQTSDGWTETMAMQDATSGLLTMEKGQQTVLTHFVAENGATTMVVNVQPKP